MLPFLRHSTLQDLITTAELAVLLQWSAKTENKLINFEQKIKPTYKEVTENSDMSWKHFKSELKK